MYYVYLLQSRRYKRWYIGFTANIHQRISQHRNQLVQNTKYTNDWELIYCEQYRQKADALGREQFLKSGSGWRFLKKQLHHELENLES